MRGKPISDQVDLSIIAKRTTGFSGASLANLMNEAAIVAARKSKTEIESRAIQGSFSVIHHKGSQDHHLALSSAREEKGSEHERRGLASSCAPFDVRARQGGTCSSARAIGTRTSTTRSTVSRWACRRTRA